LTGGRDRNVMRPAAELEDRIAGGLLGAVVGDALGLPVEGALRDWLDANPVRGMRSGGPHGQPAGSWSDDGSLLLALAESLCDGYNLERVATAFLAWWQRGEWTPYGRVFGYGATTAAAMYRLAASVPATQAGLAGEGHSGNGALMRTLPLALWFRSDTRRMLDAAHEVSGLTHAHPRSQVCCGVYCLVAAGLLEGLGRLEAVQRAVTRARSEYCGSAQESELRHLEAVLSLRVLALPREQVRSGAYVVETLEACLWSLVRGESFRDTVLAAVNLGGDSDTVGCLTGGLAGVHFGAEAIPEEWLRPLARGADVAGLCARFCRAACRAADRA
jgi:ADP-ribosyl-[dinitrogen reductase] hydrolase